ncbi:hypothetical protein ABFA07_007493 [Porites harrisoni]
MLAYSYLGMLCRSVLAALHFNYNLRRETKVDDQGQPRLHISYPKYKEGEATVREVRVAPNYEYVAEIYESLITTPRRNLQLIEEELKQVVPDPMHSMLEKQSKDDAIRKHNERKNKETVICPPTCSEAELQTLLEESDQSRPMSKTNRSRRRGRAQLCRKCGQPRRGHTCTASQND